MNPYRANTTAWHEGVVQQGRSPAGWSTVTEFFRRQPEFVLGGALVGGALLAYWVKNRGSYTAQPMAAYGAGVGYTQPLAMEPTSRGRRRHERSRSWVHDPDGPRRMPSARLGATEDQMENLATPSSHALENGNAGATGAAYELDPRSITGG